MSPKLALILCAAFVAWLFAQDARRWRNVSFTLWIPLAWTFIVASRPISVWLAGSVDAESPLAGREDSLIDKAAFAFLVVAAVCVLLRRRLNWYKLIKENTCLFWFFIHLGISTLWADDTFVSFKRWFKHCGNLIVVLVILTEKNPQNAIRAFLAGCSFLIVPLSVVLTKYYPHLSRGYQPWTNQISFFGIALVKNMLGMSLFVCGVSLAWLLFERVRGRGASGAFSCLVLLGLTGWLLVKSHCATALACTVIGVCLLLCMEVPGIRAKVNRLGTYSMALALLVVVLMISGVWDLVVKEGANVLGRDPSLHGRAQIWSAVLGENINPMGGAGFYSFWSEERNRRLSEGFYYALGTAHNGYIEMYLSCGLIGVLLLGGLIVNAGRDIKNQVLRGSRFGFLRLALFVNILLYGLSESIFDRLGTVFVAFMLISVKTDFRLQCGPAGGKIPSRHVPWAERKQASVPLCARRSCAA